MTDGPQPPEGFEPIEAEPTFATAPPPDWIRPHADEPQAEEGRSRAEDDEPQAEENEPRSDEGQPLIRTDVTFKTQGDVQRVDRETFEAAIASARASGADVTEIDESGGSSGPISVKVKTDVRFKTKTIGPDGTVTVHEADPQAAKAIAKTGVIVFSFVVAFGCVGLALLAWVLLDVLR